MLHLVGRKMIPEPIMASLQEEIDGKLSRQCQEEFISFVTLSFEKNSLFLAGLLKMCLIMT